MTKTSAHNKPSIIKSQKVSPVFFKNNASWQKIIDSNLDIEEQIRLITNLMKQNKIKEQERFAALDYLANAHAVLADWFTGSYSIYFTTPPADFEQSDLYIAPTSNPQELQCTLRHHLFNHIVTAIISFDELGLTSHHLPKELSPSQYQKLIQKLSEAGYALSKKNTLNRSMTHLESAISILQCAKHIDQITNAQKQKIVQLIKNYSAQKERCENEFTQLLEEDSEAKKETAITLINMRQK